MNRKERRAAQKLFDQKAEKKPKPDLVAKDEAVDEVHVFMSSLTDAVHQTIVDSGYHDEERRVLMAPRVVQGLGLTAASFAIMAGTTEAQFCEAMQLYYRQTFTELQAALGGKAAPPSIIVPPEGN